MVWCKCTENTGGRQWGPTTGLTHLLSLPCVSSLSSQPCFQLQHRQNKHETNVISHSRLKAIILGAMFSHSLICYEFVWDFLFPWLLLQPCMLMIIGRRSNRQQLMGFKTKHSVNGGKNRHNIHLYTITITYNALSKLKYSGRVEILVEMQNHQGNQIIYWHLFLGVPQRFTWQHCLGKGVCETQYNMHIWALFFYILLLWDICALLWVWVIHFSSSIESKFSTVSDSYPQ